MGKKNYEVIIPPDVKPKPDDYEKMTAKLMSEFLKSDISFVRRESSTTPDILVVRLNQIWEIKNIRGNNENTINRNLKGIWKQSENVIITLFRSKMTPSQAKGRIKEKLSRANRLKRVVLITKSKKLIKIKDDVV